MPGAIGVNLRVTGHSSQGGRKYMEDFFSVAYQQSEDERGLEYAFFGIFDGHGGSEAAAYAKEHLMRFIVNQKQFWSDNDADVLRAIREGYIATHKAMWREQEKWPRTATGLPSTAGTTATVAFIRHGKIYIGHVGDSGIVLGYQDPEGALDWKAKPLTQDHKPECDIEKARIMTSGGKVVAKSGVSRVVWTRPRLGHKGPIRRSTPIDEIPFLAVARSLGDLWSYNSQRNEFVVSPDPDTLVVPIEENFRCLVFGTDGLWNVLSPNAAVDIVRNAEYINDRNYYCSKELLNPSRCLVNRALEKWSTTRIRADNTTVVSILLDPPGGPKRKQRDTLYSVASAQTTVNRSGGPAAYDDWHTMDEECLNEPGAVMRARTATRNVEEELDLLNESLYNHTHQYNHHDHHQQQQQPNLSGGDSFHLHAFGISPPVHSNYEHYMNLPSAPPGGFLQSHLQGSQHMLHAMSLHDYDANAQPGAPNGDGDLENIASTSSAASPFGHHGPPLQQNLPTFSHLLEDTYSLTRLETRLEQLTNSAATSGSSMYANYQQLIETTTNYCPQVDLNTINTFHDYAGIPIGAGSSEGMDHPHHHQESSIGDREVDGGGGGGGHYKGAPGDLDYAMEQEKFDAWNQDWEHQQSLCVPSTSSSAADESLRGVNQPEEARRVNDGEISAPESHSNVSESPCDIEIPTSSNSDLSITSNTTPTTSTCNSPNQRDKSTSDLTSIQINEVTSSGVVPTPPLAQDLSSLPVKEKDRRRVNRSKLLVAPTSENLPLRRLRCHKEKENKSQPTATTTTTVTKVVRERRRLDNIAETLTVAVTTRRSAAVAPPPAPTRKSAATCLRSNNNANNRPSLATRQTTKHQTPVMAAAANTASGAKTKVEKMVSRRNLLINSSKFNQQEEEAVLKRVGKDECVALSAASVMVGRRLSKRDKVTKTINMAKKAAGGGASPSWRNVTKSTVQTRNRVQKR